MRTRTTFDKSAAPRTKRGKPLEPEARTFFEPRFGHDFSRVRVHTGAQAAESARGVNARAYAVGEDIVLGANQQPSTPQGLGLLAHELAHVVQQGRGGPSSGAETGAQAAVAQLAGGFAVPAQVVGGAEPGVYRAGTEETPPIPIDPSLLPLSLRTPPGAAPPVTPPAKAPIGFQTPHLADLSGNMPKAPMPSLVDKPLPGPRATPAGPAALQSAGSKKAGAAAEAPETLSVPGTDRYIRLAIRLSPPSPDVKLVDGKIPDAYVRAALQQAFVKAEVTGNPPPDLDKGQLGKIGYSLASTYFLADLTAKLAASLSSKQKGGFSWEITINMPSTNGGASTAKAKFSGAGFQALSVPMIGIGGRF